jgi:hypothetical protein
MFIPPWRERREHAIYKELLRTIPKLEERLMTGSEDEVTIIAELVGVVAHSDLPNVIA